ncbi:MAG TPA: hypothetical protein ENK43_17395 [Planctomycetes bacterium]|nr:hypothetical protein [Planctomycetota bacterium]
MPLICENTVVAVTGLDAGANPHPGAEVALALRADPDFKGRIVGLVYDTMVTGGWMDDLFDEIHLAPWPGDDEAMWLRRLLHLRRNAGIDVILPCLDSDVPTLARLAPRLRAEGLHALMPSEKAVKSRFKWNLSELARRVGVSTPRTAVLYDADQIHPLAGWRFPVFIKGALADCRKAHDREEAAYLFRAMARRWGYPVLIQQPLAGTEYLMTGVCGRPGVPHGAFVVKKVRTTDLGKAVAGVTVDHPHVMDLGRRLLEELEWVGPFEVEFLEDAGREDFHLIEINGRFPAWISFAADLGLPIVTDAVRLALGGEVPPRLPPPAGLHFSRTFRSVRGRVLDSPALRAAARVEAAENRTP